MVRAAAKPGMSFAYPFAVAADSFIPATASATTPHQFALFAYNVDPKDLVVSGKMKMPDGSTRDAAVAVAKATSGQLVLDLKTDGLAAGQYALDLSVQPKAGGWTKTYTVPVWIR